MSGGDDGCRWLRSRATYGEVPGLEADAGGAWCLLTHEPAGPDDAVADAVSCRLGRSCFQSRRAALARAPGAPDGEPA